MIQENRVELIAMRQRYKPKHPKMIQAEAVYQDIYVRFRREIKRATKNELEQKFWLEYKPEMDVLDERIKANDEGSAKALDEWLALVQNALSSRASRLNARVAHQQQRYQSITKRMTEINVADEDEDSNIRIVEAAFIGKTLESTRLIYLAAGSVVGLMGGFGVAFLLGLIDYKIYDVRSVEEATGLNCLSAVPESKLFLRTGKNWESIFIREPNSANAEAIRNLRASIILLGKKDRHKTLLVTSAIPSEGKTTISEELATAFAMNKEKTLLLDFDLRRPRVMDYFPVLKDASGVVDVLAGQAQLSDVIKPSGLENLYLIGSGSKAPNPAELLHEDELVKILDELAPQFDRIIVDSAPVLPVSDSRVIAKHIQSVILVVRARKAPVGAVLRARDLLEEGGGRVAGVVLNGMKKSAGAAGYYGYKGYGEYGAEGGYGYYGEEK
jgi:capsular exopolysaccharide synthesis family protein